MRFHVIDASVIVSAALTRNGASARAIVAARKAGVIALSSAVMHEVEEVIERPKFLKTISTARRAEIIELITAEAFWFEPDETVRDCRDEKDNKYLQLAAVAGDATIITGDDDLLVLDPWRGVRIVRPAEFLELLAGSRHS